MSLNIAKQNSKKILEKRRLRRCDQVALHYTMVSAVMLDYGYIQVNTFSQNCWNQGIGATTSRGRSNKLRQWGDCPCCSNVSCPAGCKCKNKPTVNLQTNPEVHRWMSILLWFLHEHQDKLYKLKVTWFNTMIWNLWTLPLSYTSCTSWPTICSWNGLFGFWNCRQFEWSNSWELGWKIFIRNRLIKKGD